MLVSRETVNFPSSIGRLLPCLLFLLLILPAKYSILYLTREGLRLATSLGIMDKENGLGGQILGYNYFRHPDWAHWLIGFLAAAIALGIPFACCLLLAHRIKSRRGSPTFCGVCGTNIDSRGGCILTPHGLQCPACKTIFAGTTRSTTKASESSLLPRFIILRILAAIIGIGLAHVFLDRVMIWRFQSAFLWLGENCGSEVMRISGRIGLGADGPFYGQYAAFWNTLYAYGPTYVNAILAALLAFATFAFVSGPLGHTRLFGYRGTTRCGGCNYNLANLKSPRCPECGKVLAPNPGVPPPN